MAHPFARRPPQVREVHTAEGLAALRAEWQELSADCPHGSPFAFWEWASSWWAHFGGDGPTSGPARALRLLCARDDRGRLIGIAPFYGWDEGTTGTAPRALRMLGDDGRDGEGMTDEPVLLLRPSHEREALDAVLTHLLGGQRRPDFVKPDFVKPDFEPDFIKLRLQSPEPLLPHSPALAGGGFSMKLRNRWEAVRGDCSEARWLPGGRTTGGWFLRTKRQRGSEAAALPRDWEAYRRSLSRSMRDNLSYYPRRLERDGYAWSIRLARTPQEVRAAAPILAALHNERARSMRGPTHGSHIPDERHRRFLADCLPRMAAQGRAFIGLVEIGGQAVAAQAFLEAASTVTFYYSGFSGAWHGYSPLTILHAAVIRDAIARGIRRLSFLPGGMPWKQRWGAGPAGVIEEMAALRVSPGALARMSLRSLGRSVSGR